MRVWDLPAGYLNRQSLLGEHREIHGIHSILTQNKTGFASHPETLRWVRTLSGLAMRHRQLAGLVVAHHGSRLDSSRHTE